MTPEDHNKTLLELTAQIVAAHVGKNQVPTQGLPALIDQVYTALKTATSEAPPVVAEKQAPFVPAKRSVFPDYIICLEDGRKLKTLKRHLRSTYGLSPEQYREKWNLPPDYPMVAPNYAEHRSKLAKQLGLGRKQAAEEIEEEAEVAPVAAKPVPQPQPKPPAQPAPAAIPEIPHTRRRTEHTAASVFSGFPGKQAEPAAEPAEESLDAKGGKKRGRKPFSKQTARSMRQ
jgi:predicted transcriptional regulator